MGCQLAWFAPLPSLLLRRFNGRGLNGCGDACNSNAAPELVTGGLLWAQLLPSVYFVCGLTRESIALCWGGSAAPVVLAASWPLTKLICIKALRCLAMPLMLMWCLPACLPACIPACLPSCLPSCLPACIPACIPACPPHHRVGLHGPEHPRPRRPHLSEHNAGVGNPKAGGWRPEVLHHQSWFW